MTKVFAGLIIGFIFGWLINGGLALYPTYMMVIVQEQKDCEAKGGVFSAQTSMEHLYLNCTKLSQKLMIYNE